MIRRLALLPRPRGRASANARRAPAQRHAAVPIVTTPIAAAIHSEGIDRAFTEGCGAGESAAPWYYPLSAQRWCARERSMYRQYALRAYADAAGLDELAATVPPVGGELPASLVVQAMAVQLEGPLRDFTDVLARHDAVLGPAAPR